MDKWVIWVQFEADVENPGDLDKKDVLDIMHVLRKEHILDILDDRDIEVKLREDV